MVGVLQLSSKPKVHYYWFVLLIKHDILGFDVAMDDPFAMDIFEPFKKFLDKRLDFR